MDTIAVDASAITAGQTVLVAGEPQRVTAVTYVPVSDGYEAKVLVKIFFPGGEMRVTGFVPVTVVVG